MRGRALTLALGCRPKKKNTREGQKLMDYIINAYVRLRSGDADENGQDLQYTSARTLLGILRLAQALVR